MRMEIHQRETELSALQNDNEKKRCILDTQEFSQHDLDRIRKEQQELDRQIERADKENKDIDAEIWETEMKIGKQHSKVLSDQKIHKLPLMN